jgi:exopolysaccharide biosynthesis polyprenyl glycosylphosphotransferase
MLSCEVAGVKVSVAMNYFNLKLSRIRQVEMGGFPLLTFESGPSFFWPLVCKRFMDILISLILLILLSPLMVVTALTVKLTSRGPVFFRQERCSLNRRKFTLYKFRTMDFDAESKRRKLVRKNEMKGPAFKITNDPRVNTVGRFLRKTSIDELPQLWNVLVGDMSLVGPRPPIPAEVAKYEPWHRRRLSMRPGITCLWQIGGRNRINDFNEWARLDLEYIDRWSLWLDIVILLKTVPVVLMGTGAR